MLGRAFFLVMTVAVIGLSGCQRGGVKQATGPEAPVVPVSHPIRRDVTDFVDFTGRTNAKDSVSIQPRVTGYLVKMPFKEGADVRQGDLLFEVDPRPYQAQYKAAEAQVELNKASLGYAFATNERFKALAKKQPGAVSDRELDQYKALEDQAKANLAVANANLDSAKLNLEWTKVTAPIDGRVSRYYLTIGNLVNQDVTQLTTIMSIDPMYVYFDMDESTNNRLKLAGNPETSNLFKDQLGSRSVMATTAVGTLSPLSGQGPLFAASVMAAEPNSKELPVLMGLGPGEGFPYQGVINFIDNQFNPNTGSISVRGQFANPKPAGSTPLLVPGMFVRVRLPIGQPHPALLVIDRAVTSEQNVKYVYVVDAENKIQQRKVTTGPLQEDGLRVITQGLEPTDWVVIGALQQVRPRLTIQPEQMTMPSLGSPAGKAPPAAAPKGKGG
jgi:multidrug efflux system membrane fusion protein